MQEFQVGRPFPLPRVEEEGAVFSVEPYTMMLIYRYQRPTEEEIAEFTNGKVELAVADMRGVLLFLSKIGSLNWADAAYSTHLTDRKKALPDLEEGQGYSLDAFLVDCVDNTLAAHRLIRMNTRFSRELRGMLEDEEKRPFDPQAFDRQVADIFRAYRPKDLAKFAQLTMRG